MKYDIKVVSADKFTLIEYQYGERIQYIELKFGKENYQGVINLDKRTQAFIPEYFADKILSEVVNG